MEHELFLLVSSMVNGKMIIKEERGKRETIYLRYHTFSFVTLPFI